MTPILEIERILAAPRHIDPVFLNTPVVQSAGLDQVLGCTVFAKVETLNPIRSFKGRGTELYAAACLEEGDRVVCGSAGNFGQGLARAAKRRGASCRVYAARTANPKKIQAMRALGAEVVLAGEDFDAAKALGRRYAGDHGLRFVEDGAESTIAEGAGTIGIELAMTRPQLDTVVVPLGNGALLAGVGAALRYAAPQASIVAVVAGRAPAMKLSLMQGQVIETETAETIADGVAVRVPLPVALNMLRGRYDSLAEASETQILQAMRMCLVHFGLVVEPAGALGIAAILAEPARYAGQRVGTILCGSNVTSEVWRKVNDVD